MKKIRLFLGTCFCWVGIRICGGKLKLDTSALMDAEKKKAIDELDQYYNTLNGVQQDKYTKYSVLQNEIIKVYIKFCQEMQEVNGSQMDELRDLWVGTVNGLNTTYQNAFSHRDDISIKKHLYLIQQQSQIAVDSSQEFFGSGKGPVGNA